MRKSILDEIDYDSDARLLIAYGQSVGIQKALRLLADKPYMTGAIAAHLRDEADEMQIDIDDALTMIMARCSELQYNSLMRYKGIVNGEKD